MINEIRLKFGHQRGAQPLTFKPGGVTVLVGPNNSGKSLILREIETFSRMGSTEDRKIIDNISYILPNRDKLREILVSKSLQPLSNENVREGDIFVGRINLIEGQLDKILMPLNALLSILDNYNKVPDKDIPGFICSNSINLFTIRLDGKTRFALTDDRLFDDLQREPTSHLMALFKDAKSRRTIRNITADTFGLYFTIDPAGLNRFRIRMSLREPSDSLEEQALDERARAFHANASGIAELSDGIKAFTGIISALFSSDYKIILIDEPEAFLHPPLIRKLGNYLARIATEREANVFSATHSSDFLMGCVQSGKPVNIIRLTYSSGTATARHLSSDKLKIMMRDPLMRSSGVLSALFHESAIVCEADTDRVFYQEIN
jgi:ABC-type polar amino acid transport system ATPase subunit